MDLLLHVIRDEDNRLRGTRAGRRRASFSGTLELLRVFKELFPPPAPEPAED